MIKFNRAKFERLVLVVFGTNPDEEDAKVEHLETLAYALESSLSEIDRLRPVVDACVRVAELDDICLAHYKLHDQTGVEAEAELESAVALRAAEVAKYRKGTP